MINTKEKIFKFMRKLQTQQDILLWSIAHEEVIYGSALNRTPRYGRKQKKLRGVLELAYKINASDLIIFFSGLLHVIIILNKRRKLKAKKSERGETKLNIGFASFGSSSDEFVYDRLQKELNEPLFRINWVTYEGTTEFGKIGVFGIIRKLFRNSFGATKRFKRAIPEISSHIIDFLTATALNVGEYTFFQLGWEQARKLGLKEIIFLAPSMAAFAAVNANYLTTRFTQHGLFAQTVLLPKFNRIDTITSYEKKYLKELCPDIFIQLDTHTQQDQKTKQKTILLLSPNVLLDDRLPMWQSFLEWFSVFNFKVIIRPTIKVSQEERNSIQRKFPNCVVDDFNVALDKSFDKWQPMFVVAWGSTGLALGLERGIIPISLSKVEMDDGMRNMIYPIQSKVLFWPRDESKIKLTIHSSKVFDSEVVSLHCVV